MHYLIMRLFVRGLVRALFDIYNIQFPLNRKFSVLVSIWHWHWHYRQPLIIGKLGNIIHKLKLQKMLNLSENVIFICQIIPIDGITVNGEY